MNCTATVPLTLKKATSKESPTADSAAATISTKKAKSWPKRESKDKEAEMKIRLIASKRSSIDISKEIMFLRLTTIPRIPIRNNKKQNNINSVGKGEMRR